MALRTARPPIVACVFLMQLMLLVIHPVQSAQPVIVSEPPSPSIRTMETVVVSGVQPGPGLWKVSNSAGHELWVLGAVVPAPRRMEWQSREVEEVLARADEVIWSPQLAVSVDAGFFGTLALMPKAIGARNNPDGKTLEQVVPPTLYARWTTLKQRYMGRDRGVEKRRPMFAAMTLYEAALERSGLAQGRIISPVVKRAVKARRVRMTTPKHTVKIADPKAALAEFKTSGMDDLGCFDTTMRRLETDLGNMTLRANAWATGDIPALRALPYEDQNRSCMEAAMQSEAIGKRGGAEVEAKVRNLWLAEAQRALADNAVTFAVLPMRELLAADGYLSVLKARGYSVQSPE